MALTPYSWKIVTTANCTFSMPFECPPVGIWVDTVGTSVTATVEGIAATLPQNSECWLDVEYLANGASPQASFVNNGMQDLLATPAAQPTSTAVWSGSTAAFKLAVTFTAAQAGWIYARVKVARPSATIYIDPKVTLS